MELLHQTTVFFVCMVTIQIATCISMLSDDSPTIVIRHEGEILSDSRLKLLLNVTRVSIDTSTSNLNEAVENLDDAFKKIKAGIETGLEDLIENIVVDMAANSSLSKEEIESRVKKSNIFEIPTQVIFDLESYSQPKIDEAKALAQDLINGFSNVTNYVFDLINSTNSCVMGGTCADDLWTEIADSTVDIPKKIYSDTKNVLSILDEIQDDVSADGIFRTTTIERTINAKISEILGMNRNQLTSRGFFSFFKRKYFKKVHKVLKKVVQVVSAVACVIEPFVLNVTS